MGGIISAILSALTYSELQRARHSVGRMQRVLREAEKAQEHDCAIEASYSYPVQGKRFSCGPWAWRVWASRGTVLRIVHDEPDHMRGTR